MSRPQTLAYLNDARFAQPPARTTPRVVVASSGLHAFTSRLSSLGKLSGEEVELLRGLGRFPRSHAPGTEIGAEATPGMARIVVAGWACRQRVLGDGRRQILNFILPGDVIGKLERPELPCGDSFVALTQLVTADASALVKAITSGDPAYRGLARAARLLAQHETALMHDQIVRLGRQTAYERMLHLMLELHARLQLAGLASEDEFAMPLTQDVLSDCLGLSVVHVNRTLQQIRRDRLLHIGAGQVRILDLTLMQTVADWSLVAIAPNANVSRGRASMA